MAVTTGADELNRKFAEIVRGQKKGVRRVLYKSGHYILGVALPLTPIDLGNLRGSSFVEPVEDENGPGVVIGYTANYAAYVHETNKNYVAPGTQWKFLETAVNRSREFVVKEAVKELKRINRGT